MGQEFVVKGVTPLGRVVETVVRADSESAAREKASGLGLRFASVRPANSGAPAAPPAPPPAPPAAPPAAPPPPLPLSDEPAAEGETAQG